MQMPDVNILVYAHREESHDHERYSAWLSRLAKSAEPFALSESVAHGFVRVVTNRRIFVPPSTPAEAFRFLDPLMARPNCVLTRPGPRHWSIFRQLCEHGNLQGKIVADAVHAALAIEAGCEW